MLHVPLVRECMSTTFFTLHPEQDVFEAIDALVAKRASGAPVVDDQNRILGILTEKDCIRLLSVSAYNNLIAGSVREFMSEVKMTVTANMDLFAVAQIFLSTHFPALPVVDENGALIGRITRMGILRGIQHLMCQIERQRARLGREQDSAMHPRSIEDFQNLVASANRRQLAEVFSRRLAEDAPPSPPHDADAR